MRRTITGWFLAVTGFLACPCHLVVTLPLAAALLSGTALGGWITTHQGALVVGASGGGDANRVANCGSFTVIVAFCCSPCRNG